MYIRAFDLKQLQEIIGSNFNSYTPKSFQNMMGRSYIPTDITRWGKGTGLPALFQKLEYCALIQGKNAMIAVICGLNFLLKVRFLRVYRSVNQRFFPAVPFFFMLQMIIYRNALIPKRTPLLQKASGNAPDANPFIPKYSERSIS